MTSDDSHTRRDCLRIISATGAVVGGGAIGVSSVSAGGDPGGPGSEDVDPERIDLDSVCVDGDHDLALFCVTNDNEKPARLEWTASPAEAGVFFIDCRTVRVVGDFAEVMIEAVFETDAGIGDFHREFGPVDGSAVFDISGAGNIPEGSIIRSVDAFREGTPVVPGGGDVSVQNPAYEACQEEHFGEIIDSASSEDAGDATGPAETGSDGSDGDGREGLVVPPNATRCFAASGEGGVVTVDLFLRGERIATASSGATAACPIPIWWWNRLR